MTDIATVRPALPGATSQWLKKRAFGSLSDSVMSVVFFALLLYVAYTVLDWAIFSAVWSAEAVDQCPEARGACWSVVAARHRLILFGLYPFDLHWRSTLACGAIIATVILSCLPYFWTVRRLAALWIAGFGAYYLLMEGSPLGLDRKSVV